MTYSSHCTAGAMSPNALRGTETRWHKTVYTPVSQGQWPLTPYGALKHAHDQHAFLDILRAMALNALRGTETQTFQRLARTSRWAMSPNALWGTETVLVRSWW